MRQWLRSIWGIEDDGSGHETHKLLFLLLPLAANAQSLEGRVVKVVDGDTVYVLDAAQTQHKIRLAGIDAPERGQPFGKRAKERMADLVAGREVRVDLGTRDACTTR